MAASSLFFLSYMYFYFLLLLLPTSTFGAGKFAQSSCSSQGCGSLAQQFKGSGLRSPRLSPLSPGQLSECPIPDARPPPSQRMFTSEAVENTISQMVPKFADPNLAQLFANTLPNALDTTVYQFTSNGTLDTFLITGDIPAMWLRDSTNQVLPYLRFIQEDLPLRQLVQGLIGRQARSILIDPYANAFQVDSSAGQGPHSDDSTTRPAFAGTTIDAMTPLIYERKWELDSLANPLRLAALYYNATNGDTTPFTAEWLSSVQLILETMIAQQLSTEEEDNNGGPPYLFQRTTGEPSDTLEHSRGAVASHSGMIKCGFRGSDDALVLPFNVAENAFASAALEQVSYLLEELSQPTLASQASSLSAQLKAAIATNGTYSHPSFGLIYAYEVDGFGNYYFMDDANIPGLLSMPYYGFVSNATSDSLYAATRAAILSSSNPYYMCGSAGCGVGGPHNGYYWIWPMSIAVQAWTSDDDTEIQNCLSQLLQSSACTGLMHESFDRNNFGSYTRPWFSWMNSLFADLILKIAEERPYLIFKS